MLKELIKKIRNKGIRKIIYSMIGEIVVVAVVISADDIELVARIICLIIWQIPILRHFIDGILMATTGEEALFEYVKESGIPFEMLEKEMKFTTKIQNIYIGHTHIFSNNAKEIIVMIVSIFWWLFFKKILIHKFMLNKPAKLLHLLIFL